MPPRRRHDAALRRRLLEVGSEVISRHGADGLSLRTLAAEAGTTTAAVYTLFGSRRQLIEAVAAEGFERFGKHLDAVARTGDAAADLFSLGLAYRASALADPHFYRVMFGLPGLHPAASEPTFVTLREAVERLTGGPRKQAEEDAYRLWSLAHGLMDLELSGHLPGDESVRSERYAATLQSIGPAIIAAPPEPNDARSGFDHHR